MRRNNNFHFYPFETGIFLLFFGQSFMQWFQRLILIINFKRLPSCLIQRTEVLFSIIICNRYIGSNGEI